MKRAFRRLFSRLWAARLFGEKSYWVAKGQAADGGWWQEKIKVTSWMGLEYFSTTEKQPMTAQEIQGMKITNLCLEHLSRQPPLLASCEAFSGDA